MKFFCNVVIVLLLTQIVKGQTPVDDLHWNNVFVDEFNSLNTSIWYVRDYYDHFGERQVYLDDNVSCSNGNLIIEIKEESLSCPAPYQIPQFCKKQYKTGLPYNWTSGDIETRSNYNIQYGYIESRIKLPYGKGFWPAFWTSVGDGVYGAQNAAEIDIFEMTGDKPSTIIGTNMHMEYCRGCDNSHPCKCDHYLDQWCPWYNSSILCYGKDLVIPDYANVWRVYAIEWNPSKIIWYLDDKIIRVSPNPGIVDPVKIILNLALHEDPDITTPLPSKMYVDYVKMYQLVVDTAVINTCNYDFSNYNNKVKKSITIGGVNCYNALSSNDNITLRATDYIRIDGDFYVPTGAEFYMDVNLNQ